MKKMITWLFVTALFCGCDPAEDSDHVYDYSFDVVNHSDRSIYLTLYIDRSSHEFIIEPGSNRRIFLIEAFGDKGVVPANIYSNYNGNLPPGSSAGMNAGRSVIDVGIMHRKNWSYDAVESHGTYILTVTEKLLETYISDRM